MEPNAWDRAREAIARATERDDAVVTPDNAVSPFDASATMVIPQADVHRRAGPPHPDATQRLTGTQPGEAPRRDPRGGPPGPPAPRSPGDGGPGPYRPVRVREAGVDPPPRSAHPAPRSTHLPPEPPTRPVEVSDPRGVPARVAGERPGTAPFNAVDMPDTPPDGAPHADGARPRRSWWRRLFGR